MATQEERDALAKVERLKGKVENIMVQMQSALLSDPVPTLSLRRKIKNSEKVWSEFEEQYDQLRSITEENQAEQDRDDYTAFQGRYFEVHGRAEDALDNEQSTEEARLKALASKQKVQQYTAGWKAVHHRIEKALEEIETSLEGDAIASLEVLKVEEDQLMQVKESLKESASLMDSIITEDPEQTDAMMDSEAAKSVQAVSKIRACKKRLAGF